MNGPGLTAPGVYAAGLHDTASQAATLLTAATAAPVTASFHGVPSEVDSGGVASAPANNALNGFSFPGTIYSEVAPGSNDTLSSAAPSSFANVILTLPAVGFAAFGEPVTPTAFAGSSTSYTGTPSDYTSWSWNVSSEDGVYAGTLAEVQFGEQTLGLVTLDFAHTSTLTWSSDLSSWSGSETYSGTSYYGNDASFSSMSDSFSYGSITVSDGTGGSYSFWGGGDSYTETGTAADTGSGPDNSTLSSGDNWKNVDSQYTGSAIWGSAGVPTTLYSLSGDIESGSDASEVVNTSVSTAATTSESSVNSSTHSSSSVDYSAGQNDINNVNSYSSGDSGTDTYQSSWSSGTDTTSDNSAGTSSTVTSGDSSTGENDHYSDTLTYDGQGHTVTVHTVTETVTVSNDSSGDSSGESTLSGYPDTWTSDQSSQNQGTGHASDAMTTSNGVTSAFNDTSGSGSAQASTATTGTDTYSINGGWSDTAYSSNAWGSWDQQYDDGASSDGLGGTANWDSTSQTQYGSDTLTSHKETSTSLAGSVNDSTLDSTTNGAATSTVEVDDTATNGVSNNWNSSSYNGGNTWNTNNTDTTSVSISGGWDRTSYGSDSWGNIDSITTAYASTGGTGNPDNSNDSTVSESWGDTFSTHAETSTVLSGLSNDNVSNSWTNDTASETLTDNDDLTTLVNLSSTTFGATGGRGGNTSDDQNSHTFSDSSLDHGTEGDTSGTSWAYNYNDQSDLTTKITGPYFSSVVSTTSDSTHNDSGQDTTFNDDQGSDTFSSTSNTPSTGTSTQDSGGEQFGYAQDYSDAYTDQTVSHTSNDGAGHTSSSRTINHTDQGSNGWSWNVEGSDTFSMTATDPSTSESTWDIGAENYIQDQGQTSSFGDTSTSTSTVVNGTPTTSSTLTHTGGGADTLSSGDQVGHNYGDITTDPTTGDVDSDTGTDNYTLIKFYGDTYTNFSSGPVTTHTDSGSAGATYTDQGTETDLTPTTDPDTGDVSTDDDVDSFAENDGSTQSFTDQSSLTSTTINDVVNSTDSTSHTDNGSDSVSSDDQDTDISSDTANNGLSTDGNSDTTTEWDSSSDSYGDQSSNVETTLGSSVTVTNSSTYTDLGSDTDSSNDQGTDTSSDASSDGLEADSSGDTYTNTESSSDGYSDQSFDFENVASGVVVSAASSDSNTDSGTDSTSSYDYGSDSESSASDDGLESDSGSDTYTNTESSSDGYGDQSYDSDSESGGQSLSATSTDSDTDNETDSSWSYDAGTDFPSSASEDGTDSDSSSNTYTTTETSGDTSCDQCTDSETESGGSLISATSSATSVETDTDNESDVENGTEAKTTPTDSGSEVVTTTYSETDTSSDSDTDTSCDTDDDEEGTTTGTDTTTSDSSGMESSTETSSGTESFDGVEEDDSDYSGSGGFTGSSFDSTTYTDHDGSDTTTDAAGKLNGTESQNDYELHTWNETRQDVDSVSAPGDDESDTDTDQDYGTTTKQVNILTSYTEGTPTEQGGTTIQKDDTNSFTEADPEDEVTNNNATNFIPAAGESGPGKNPPPARYVAGQPAGSSKTTMKTGSGTVDADALEKAVKEQRPGPVLMGRAGSRTINPGNRNNPEGRPPQGKGEGIGPYISGAGHIAAGVSMVQPAVGLTVFPEPTLATKFAAVGLWYLIVDNLQTGARELYYGEYVVSMTAQAGSGAASTLGLSPSVSRGVGTVFDLGVNLVVPVAANRYSELAKLRTAFLAEEAANGERIVVALAPSGEVPLVTEVDTVLLEIKPISGGVGVDVPSGAMARSRSFGEWFRFWEDAGGVTTYLPVANQRLLGPKYTTVIINHDAPGTAAHLDTAAHEGFHALVGKYLPSVVDAGDLAIGRIPIGAPVKYVEETLAYGIGHLAAGRVHGAAVAPIEVFLSGSLTRGEKVVTIIVGGTAAGGYVVYELLDGN